MGIPQEPQPDEFAGAVPPPEGEVPLGDIDRHHVDWESGEVQDVTGGVLAPPKPEEEPSKLPTNPKAFPDEAKTKFRGLMFLGHLTDSFSWLGHEFVIKTVTEDDLLEVALLHERYRHSLGANKAYQMAVCAASIISVDGQMMPEPLGHEAEGERFQARWNIVRKWYPPTVREVYSKFLDLENDVEEVIKAMGGASG